MLLLPLSPILYHVITIPLYLLFKFGEVKSFAGQALPPRGHAQSLGHPDVR